MRFGNDIIDALSDLGLDSILAIIRPLLKFLYDLVGMTWRD